MKNFWWKAKWRIIVIVTYGLACLGGISFMAFDHREIGIFETERALPKNHRLQPGDVGEAWWPRRFMSPSFTLVGSLSGRYVRVESTDSPHAVFDYSGASSAPDITVSGRKYTILWIPVDGGVPIQGESVDVGSRVNICGLDTGACEEDLKVLAVSCNAQSQCSVATAVDTVLEKKIASAMNSKPATVRAQIHYPERH